jgi:hypothetical protein
MKPDEVLFKGASKNEGPIKRSIVWIDGSGHAIVTCRKDSSTGLVTQVRESLEELQKSQATRFQDLGSLPQFLHAHHGPGCTRILDWRSGDAASGLFHLFAAQRNSSVTATSREDLNPGLSCD